MCQFNPKWLMVSLVIGVTSLLPPVTQAEKKPETNLDISSNTLSDQNIFGPGDKLEVTLSLTNFKKKEHCDVYVAIFSEAENQLRFLDSSNFLSDTPVPYLENTKEESIKIYGKRLAFSLVGQHILYAVCVVPGTPPQQVPTSPDKWTGGLSINNWFLTRSF